MVVLIFTKGIILETMVEPSIFTKIINGEIPCYKVYEDERVIAILDLNPLTPGHIMVIPKIQINHLWDMEDELYQYVMAIAKKIALRQREVLQPKRIGITVEGFGVPHAHVHVFPLYKGLVPTTLEYAQKDDTRSNPQALADMAAKLAF